MSESRRPSRLASIRKALARGKRQRAERPSAISMAPSVRLPLGHAPDAETLMSLLTAAAMCRPAAFRDPSDRYLTPVERAAIRAGMMKAPPRDPFRRETQDGSRPGDRDRTGLKPRKFRGSLRMTEVHRARVRFTQQHQHPRYLKAEARQRAYPGMSLQQAIAAWDRALGLAIPAAPSLDAA